MKVSLREAFGKTSPLRSIKCGHSASETGTLGQLSGRVSEREMMVMMMILYCSRIKI